MEPALLFTEVKKKDTWKMKKTDLEDGYTFVLSLVRGVQACVWGLWKL